MITITGIDDFPTAGDAVELADGRTALCLTHFPTPGTSEVAYSAAYVVTGSQAVKVIQSEPFGKDIASWITMKGNILRLWATEPPPGGGGAAARLDVYEVNIGVGAAGGAGSAGIDQALRNWLAAGPK